jgi:hypothetical protein
MPVQPASGSGSDNVKEVSSNISLGKSIGYVVEEQRPFINNSMPLSGISINPHQFSPKIVLQITILPKILFLSLFLRKLCLIN